MQLRLWLPDAVHFLGNAVIADPFKQRTEESRAFPEGLQKVFDS